MADNLPLLHGLVLDHSFSSTGKIVDGEIDFLSIAMTSMVISRHSEYLRLEKELPFPKLVRCK